MFFPLPQYTRLMSARSTRIVAIISLSLCCLFCMAADDEAFSLENAHRQAFELEKAQDWQGLLKHSKRWIEGDAESAIAWYILGFSL